MEASSKSYHKRARRHAILEIIQNCRSQPYSKDNKKGIATNIVARLSVHYLRIFE